MWYLVAIHTMLQKNRTCLNICTQYDKIHNHRHIHHFLWSNQQNPQHDIKIYLYWQMIDLKIKLIISTQYFKISSPSLDLHLQSYLTRHCKHFLISIFKKNLKGVLHLLPKIGIFCALFQNNWHLKNIRIYLKKTTTYASYSKLLKQLKNCIDILVS